MSFWSDFLQLLGKKSYPGVYPARVVDNQDPHALGRVKVSLPALGDGKASQIWARLATLMAGDQRGTWFIPDVGDEVLVAFEGGDPRQPYVLGALWNADAPPPEQMDPSGHNPVKSIHSRDGVVISLYDLLNEDALFLKTPGGQSLVLQDNKGWSVEIKDANGNQILLSRHGVQVVAAAKVMVNASQVEVTAASVTVNAGMAAFSGVVKVDSLIANSVVSASYSPGAGNIW